MGLSNAISMHTMKEEMKNLKSILVQLMNKLIKRSKSNPSSWYEYDCLLASFEQVLYTIQCNEIISLFHVALLHPCFLLRQAATTGKGKLLLQCSYLVTVA